MNAISTLQDKRNCLSSIGMNGGIGAGMAATANSVNQTTSSKKRKRGLASKRKQTAAKAKAAAAEKCENTGSVVDGETRALQNGHSEEEAQTIVDNMQLTCSMCGKSEPHTTVDLRANELMRHTLLNYWKLPAKSLDSTLSSLCVQCVYKINAHKEVTRSLTIRLHRMSSRQLCNANSNIRNIQETKVPSASKQKRLNGKVERNETQRQYVETAATIDSHNDTNCCLNSTAALTPESVRASDDAVEQQLRLCSSSPLPAVTDNIEKRPLLDASSLTSPPYSPVRSCSGEVNLECKMSPKIPYHGTPEPSTPATVEKPKRRRTCVVQTDDITQVKEPRSTRLQQLNDAAHKPMTPTPEVTVLSLHPIHAFSLVSNSRSNSPGSGGAHLSMLQVVRERSEFALATESGGKINNYKRAQSLPQQLVCQYCTRVYWRKYYYTKHMRHCISRHNHQVKAKSAVAVPVRSSKSTISVEAVSVAQSEGGSEKTGTVANTSFVQFPKRLFHCPECAVTVETQVKLREHKRIHLQRFYCDSCGAEFTAYHNYDFHRVVCEATKEAMKIIATQADESKRAAAPQMALTSVRTTRSRSRAASRAATTYTSVSNCNQSHVYAGGVEHELSIDEKDAGYDEVSVADTMYTKRMRFTGNWVEDHSNSNSYLSLCDNNLYDYDDDMQINTYKEYDLYLLDCLKAQVNLKSLTCFVPNCEYSTNTLLEMMLHDYVHHFKRAWFYCQKCGCSFTSKVFLDFHLDRQNGGRFICFKCGDIFEFQHQLDRHLIRHTKFINYHCNYCNFEFLTESELLQHCDCEQHDPNGERKLIEIEPEMTIVNVVPTVPPYCSTRRRHGYAVRALNMRLPRTCTKRPMEQPGHKPYRRKIGDVEFKNQKHPNCRGWK